MSDDNCIIELDDSKLTQILNNLLNNSIKFTDAGEIEFGYQLKENDLELFVKDTGIGINSKFHKIIFESFRQSDASIALKYGGADLGLSIARAYIEFLGGKIWVKSEINKGSAFIFTIPIKQSKQKSAQNKNPESATYNWGNKNVLIIEDEESNYLYLKEVLEETQINIKHSYTGNKAIEIVKNTEQIDLILLDIKLPDINGYEVSKQIKKIRPEIPIIAQTAFALTEDSKKMFEVGCIAYLAKPIMIDDLLETINKHV